MNQRETSARAGLAALRRLPGVLLLIVLLALPAGHLAASRAAASQGGAWLNGTHAGDGPGAAELGATPSANDLTGAVNASATHPVYLPGILVGVRDKPPAPPAPTDPPPPSSCSAVNLKKGPTLILTGSNTSMKIFWQWTSNTTFTVRWGTGTGYGQGSANVTAYDATNHLYAYTITGLTPGTRYNYQVAVGSQCASSTFFAPPPDSAADVKFFAYGDTRTNAGTHNTLAGKVVARFQSDPAFQTLNLNVGDWVSGDSESAWNNEWFSSSCGNLRTQDASIADTGVRGNHESGATYWKRYFPQPWQAGGLYRSYDYGPMHIVQLDQYTSYSAGSAQYNWLKADLAASTKKWKFVVLHEPGWSAGGGHGNNTTVQNDLQPLFQQYGVSIVFGGHNHYYARAVVNGIQHLTMGGGGAPLYTPASGYANIVKTSKNYSYGEFTITGNTLSATIVTSSGSTVDTFSISAP